MNGGEGDVSTWQRWTIDEIDLGVARLAVAQARYPLESTVAEAEATDADAEVLRELVVEVEDAPPDDLWADEQPVFMPIDELRAFLKRRNDIRGLPDERPLREGDVFWVVLSPALEARTLRDMTARRVMVEAEQLDVQVWDVTAAARQAAKRTYDDALRAASDDQPALGQAQGA
jgi:hypothetical protein